MVTGPFAHPELSHRPTWDRWHIPFTMPYLDYLGRLVEEALRQVPVDGFMVDLLGNVEPTWMDCEREMFRELMGESLPGGVIPDADTVLHFNRRATERAWERIRDAAKSVNPACLIWLSVNNMHNAQLATTRVPYEVDWLMNEHSDMEAGLAMARRLAGPRTRLVQCVCGWEGPTAHDAERLLAAVPPDVGLYGFAQPDPVTTVPPEDGSVSARNIAAIRRAFRSL